MAPIDAAYDVTLSYQMGYEPNNQTRVILNQPDLPMHVHNREVEIGPISLQQVEDIQRAFAGILFATVVVQAHRPPEGKVAS